MHLHLPALCIAILLPASLGGSLKHDSNGLVIKTTSGELHGFINKTTPLVRQFLGVPYAEPPIGNLRFAPPQTKSKSRVIKTTDFGPSCMQQFNNGTTIYTAQVPEFLIRGGQSEDCLYLNIWAPVVKRNGPKKLPVFLYIPGGGFTSGGANSVYKLPHNWIQRTQSHIVVILNYRVNVFGYPNAKGLEDKNPGLLDQRKAVEWTHQNIAAFGGDPKRITLWGQSAGGASSSLYAYTYPSNPIISSIISDSGSANLLKSADATNSNFTFLAALVGCSKGLSPKAELDCVRKVPAKVLEDTLSNYGISGTLPRISFVPFPDGRTVFANNTERALKGLVARIPAIMGSNENEGAGFVPYTPAGPGAAALFAATQNIIACPLAKEVQNRELAGLSTYRYQYAGNFSNVSPVSWMGAYHSSELPLLFGTHFEFRGPSTKFEYQVSHAMEDFWLSFASDPSKRPSNNRLYWPEYRQDRDTMVLFASGKTVQTLVSGNKIDANCTA